MTQLSHNFSKQRILGKYCDKITRVHYLNIPPISAVLKSYGISVFSGKIRYITAI